MDSAAVCAAECAAVKQVEKLKGWAEPGGLRRLKS